MKLERDNFSRLVVRDMGTTFWLTPDGRLMMSYDIDRTDRRGRVWHTQHVREATGPRADRARALLQRGCD